VKSGRGERGTAAAKAVAEQRGRANGTVPSTNNGKKNERH